MAMWRIKSDSALSLKGPVTRCRAKVSYKTTSSKDEARLHRLGANMLPEVLMGCLLNAKKEGWTG